jgi:C1A family cysteine protease
MNIRRLLALCLGIVSAATNMTWKIGWNAHAHQSWDAFFRPRMIQFPEHDHVPDRRVDRGPWSPRSIHLPAAWDWRPNLPPVREQGACGSCWAFAAATTVEFLSQTPDVSEQQWIDCSRVTGNRGCSGGLAAWTYRYIQKFPHVCTEQSYPYTATVKKCQRTCNQSISLRIRRITLYFSEVRLLEAVLLQPVPVSIHASESFRLYQSGILDPTDCAKRPNHAVSLVGFGTENGTDYWILRNSWGATWGENGYFRLRRGVNRCAIGLRSTSVLVI